MQRSVVLLRTSGSVFLHLYIDQYSLLQKHSPYLGKSAFFLDWIVHAFKLFPITEKLPKISLLAEVNICMQNSHYGLRYKKIVFNLQQSSSV